MNYSFQQKSKGFAPIINLLIGAVIIGIIVNTIIISANKSMTEKENTNPLSLSRAEKNTTTEDNIVSQEKPTTSADVLPDQNISENESNSNQESGTENNGSSFTTVDSGTPTQTATSSNIVFSFSKNTSSEDEQAIRKGASTADKYLKKWFNRPIKATTTIIVNQDSSSQGCCHVGHNSNGLTASFHTTHEDWQSATIASFVFADLRQQLAMHELVHVFQGQYGCGMQDEQVALRWLQEGMAEWLSFKMLIDEESTSKDNVLGYNTFGMGLEDIGPLKDYEISHKGVAYFTFYMAVDRLLTNKSIQSLNSFCNNLGKGMTGPDAFQTSFGISLQSFYNDFETYRTSL
jgi:hypothetical protein